jgi:hypothetical protein
MPQGPAPAGPPAAVGTLDDFLGQPRSGGGAALKWGNKPDGYTITVQIARDVIDSDIRQQTDTRQVPQTFRDGRPRWVMVVPVIVPPGHPEHPDGKAQWYVKGDAHNALAEAMAKSGTSAKVPEGGAWVTITKTGTRNIGQGMSPATTFTVVYQSPNGQAQPPAAPASAAEPQWQQQQPPAPATDPWANDPNPAWQQPPAPAQQAPAWNPPGQPQWGPPPQGYANGGPVPPQGPSYVPDNGQVVPPQQAPAPQPPAPASPAPQAAPQAQGGQPAPTPEQQALLAQLAAGGAPQQQG